jgi:uncharacterized phage protein (TIGR02220 family)
MDKKTFIQQIVISNRVSLDNLEKAIDYGEAAWEALSERGYGDGRGRTAKAGSQDAIEILAFLNEKANKNYRPVAANLSMIDARLKEYTVSELRMVIAKKCREWSTDDKMAEYLRPATLFNASKCAQYVGELVVQGVKHG